MNVPKLRFKEFNDDYNLVYLENITKLIKDGTHGTHKDVENGIPLLSAKDIYNNKINIPLDARKISKEDYDKIYSKYQLKENDILITIVGTIGRTAIYKKENVAFQRSVAIIRLQRDDSSYIRNYLESSAVTTQLFNMTNSSAQGGIYLQSLSKIKLKLPSFNEQIKIGKFLSLLDKEIELQSKKIEALKLYKMCISKKFFDNKNLPTTLLKNICNIKKGQQLNNEYLKVNGIYYMLNGGMLPSGYTDNYNTLENTISISEGGNSCGYVNFNREKFWSGGHCYTVEPININNEYLFQLLKYYEKAIMSLRVGSGLPNIQKRDLELFKVAIHNQDEQKDISVTLCKIDLKIDLESKKLSNLESLKKGLMQNMFV